MKRKFIYFIVLLILIIGITGCGKKITLKQIAEKFNNSETIKTYKNYGYEIIASVNKNELIITTKNDDNNSSISYKLDGNILSNEKITNDNLISAIVLIDSIGQLNGYKDGELAENMNVFADEISKYTIEKEGFEFKDNGDTTSIKIDLSKKIPLIDLSKSYLKTDEFDMIASIVKEKSVGNQTGKIGKLAYDIQIGEDESYIYIGEREKLTESAYKSILSALEVMYGTKISDRFKSVYPTFKEEKTTIDEFTIETNYKMEDEEESIFKDTSVVLVTINNKTVKKYIK